MIGINDPAATPVTLNEAIKQVVQETVREMSKKRRNDRGNGSPALANAIRGIRMALEMSTAEFARSIGRDPSLIQKIERGDRGMSIETFARIYHGHESAISRETLRAIFDAIWQTDEASR